MAVRFPFADVDEYLRLALHARFAVERGCEVPGVALCAAAD